MPPKVKPEDLVEALLDPRVLDAVTKALAPTTSSIEAKLSKKLESFTATIQALQDKCKALSAENADLKKQLRDTDRRIDDIERYTRCDNIIIRGLPESSMAERASAGSVPDDGSLLREGLKSVEESVISFIKKSLHVDVTSADISTAHRLKAGPKDSIRPVIVRFANRRVRNDVFNAKKLLKGTSSKVFVSEHLTTSDSVLFYEARKLLRDKKIFGTWTKNGLVYVRFSPDPSAKASIVRSHADLCLRP